MAKQANTANTENTAAEAAQNTAATEAAASQPEAQQNTAAPTNGTAASAATAAAAQAAAEAQTAQQKREAAEQRMAQAKADLAAAEAAAKAELAELQAREAEARRAAEAQQQMAALIAAVGELPNRIDSISALLADVAEADSEVAELQTALTEAQAQRGKIAAAAGTQMAQLQTDSQKLLGAVGADETARDIIVAAAPRILALQAQFAEQRVNIAAASAAKPAAAAGETAVRARRTGRISKRETVRDLLAHAGPNGLTVIELYEALDKAVALSTIRTYISDMGNETYAGPRGIAKIEQHGEKFVLVG